MIPPKLESGQEIVAACEGDSPSSKQKFRRLFREVLGAPEWYENQAWPIGESICQAFVKNPWLSHELSHPR
jgi:hypothetical protein